jgi:N-acyl-D-amino-acid deacylase
MRITLSHRRISGSCAWIGVVAFVLLTAAACGPSNGASASRDILVTGASILDGTGGPPQVADVRIRDGRILAVSDPGTLTPGPDEAVVDAQGLVLAPGFIDTHSHHGGGLEEDPSALAAVSQGITTIVVGQDGGSAFPLAELFGELEAAPVAVNVGSYSGHNTLRREVLGEDFRRPATDGEIDEMRALLAEDLRAGALGLSTGLEYDPGIYSETEEVIALAQEAARYGGRYSSHMRSEDRALWEALEELIQVGREARIPVHVSHMKLAMRSLWGRAGEAIAQMDSARAEGISLTADVYPYEYWQSTMTVLLPERDFSDRSAFQFALDELVPPEGFLIARFDPQPEYVGLTLDSIARLRDTDPTSAYMELVSEVEALRAETGEGGESIIGTSMSPEDIVTLLTWPHTNVSSDGGINGRHPRGTGTFTRILGRYVREEGFFFLQEAVHKMTYQAAMNAGISERGLLRPGFRADLVLFDPETVLDNATPEDPQAISTGISRVWVNGVEVFTNGVATGNRPGMVIRGSAYTRPGE